MDFKNLNKIIKKIRLFLRKHNYNNNSKVNNRNVK